ncbi:MAG: phytanoyl-CoA dioxygenase family protein [Gammaproteobacteria bacterium]|nr:phytanoyl-CoA dioxygenase family protein [Gammaproteobacteria bacterium]
MKSLVTEQQVIDYQRNGVVLIRNLFDTRWQQILADGIEENLKNPTSRSIDYVNNPVNNAHFFYDACTYRQNAAYDRYMLESPMAECAARVMRSNSAILFYMTVFVRSAGTRNRTPWHQDQPSWSASGDHACSIWTSLDPVPAETALEFVRGSHRWKKQYQRPAFFQKQYANDNNSELLEFPDIESNREHYDIVSWAMEPGDCLAFHGMTIHGGSGDLPSTLGRRTLSVQWLGDDARFRDMRGLDDPDIGEDIRPYGVHHGGPVICGLCPVVWSTE